MYQKTITKEFKNLEEQTMGGKMSQDKKWGRPKGSKQTPETKSKISAGVKAAYKKMVGDNQ